MKQKYAVIPTNDGSHTVFSEHFNQHYHSINGAETESNHVFIEKGLKYFCSNYHKTINILEIGFGTGLNAVLTIKESYNYVFSTFKYDTYEKYPLKNNIINQLNFENNVVNALHNSPWNKELMMRPKFIFQKINEDVLESNFKNNYYDIVFFDAFAPETQPELWTLDLLQKIYNSMKPKGILTTYCAQGQFRRSLKQLGFAVEKLEGAPGKREMTRATK